MEHTEDTLNLFKRLERTLFTYGQDPCGDDSIRIIGFTDADKLAETVGETTRIKVSLPRLGTQVFDANKYSVYQYNPGEWTTYLAMMVHAREEKRTAEQAKRQASKFGPVNDVDFFASKMHGTITGRIRSREPEMGLRNIPREAAV